MEYICERLRKKVENLPEERIENFRNTVEKMMLERFENHWHPTKPLKGNAFRCLNIEDGILDPFLREVMKNTDLEIKELLAAFPQGMALWVDPSDVSCRLGKGSITPIYKKFHKDSQLNPSVPPFTGRISPETGYISGSGRYSPPNNSGRYSPPNNSGRYSPPNNSGRYSPPNNSVQRKLDTTGRCSPQNELFPASLTGRYSPDNTSSSTTWNSSWLSPYGSTPNLNQGQNVGYDSTFYHNDTFHRTNNYNVADIWKKQIQRYPKQSQTQRYSFNKYQNTLSDSYGRYHWFNQKQNQSDLRSYSSEYELRPVAQIAY